MEGRVLSEQWMNYLQIPDSSDLKMSKREELKKLLCMMLRSESTTPDMCSQAGRMATELLIELYKDIRVVRNDAVSSLVEYLLSGHGAVLLSLLSLIRIEGCTMDISQILQADDGDCVFGALMFILEFCLQHINESSTHQKDNYNLTIKDYASLLGDIEEYFLSHSSVNPSSNQHDTHQDTRHQAPHGHNKQVKTSTLHCGAVPRKKNSTTTFDNVQHNKATRTFDNIRQDNATKTLEVQHSNTTTTTTAIKVAETGTDNSDCSCCDCEEVRKLGARKKPRVRNTQRYVRSIRKPMFKENYIKNGLCTADVVVGFSKFILSLWSLETDICSDEKRFDQTVKDVKEFSSDRIKKVFNSLELQKGLKTDHVQREFSSNEMQRKNTYDIGIGSAMIELNFERESYLEQVLSDTSNRRPSTINDIHDNDITHDIISNINFFDCFILTVNIVKNLLVQIIMKKKASPTELLKKVLAVEMNTALTITQCASSTTSGYLVFSGRILLRCLITVINYSAQHGVNTSQFSKEMLVFCGSAFRILSDVLKDPKFNEIVDCGNSEREIFLQRASVVNLLYDSVFVGWGLAETLHVTWLDEIVVNDRTMNLVEYFSGLCETGGINIVMTLCVDIQKMARIGEKHSTLVTNSERGNSNDYSASVKEMPSNVIESVSEIATSPLDGNVCSSEMSKHLLEGTKTLSSTLSNVKHIAKEIAVDKNKNENESDILRTNRYIVENRTKMTALVNVLGRLLGILKRLRVSYVHSVHCGCENKTCSEIFTYNHHHDFSQRSWERFCDEDSSHHLMASQSAGCHTYCLVHNECSGISHDVGNTGQISRTESTDGIFKAIRNTSSHGESPSLEYARSISHEVGNTDSHTGIPGTACTHGISQCIPHFPVVPEATDSDLKSVRRYCNVATLGIALLDMLVYIEDNTIKLHILNTIQKYGLCCCITPCIFLQYITHGLNWGRLLERPDESAHVFSIIQNVLVKEFCAVDGKNEDNDTLIKCKICSPDVQIKSDLTRDSSDTLCESTRICSVISDDRAIDENRWMGDSVSPNSNSSSEFVGSVIRPRSYTSSSYASSRPTSSLHSRPASTVDSRPASILISRPNSFIEEGEWNNSANSRPNCQDHSIDFSASESNLDNVMSLRRTSSVNSQQHSTLRTNSSNDPHINITDDVFRKNSVLDSYKAKGSRWRCLQLFLTLLRFDKFSKLLSSNRSRNVNLSFDVSCATVSMSTNISRVSSSNVKSKEISNISLCKGKEMKIRNDKLHYESFLYELHSCLNCLLHTDCTELRYAVFDYILVPVLYDLKRFLVKSQTADVTICGAMFSDTSKELNDMFCSDTLKDSNDTFCSDTSKNDNDTFCTDTLKDTNQNEQNDTFCVNSDVFGVMKQADISIDESFNESTFLWCLQNCVELFPVIEIRHKYFSTINPELLMQLSSVNNKLSSIVSEIFSSLISHFEESGEVLEIENNSACFENLSQHKSNSEKQRFSMNRGLIPSQTETESENQTAEDVTLKSTVKMRNPKMEEEKLSDLDSEIEATFIRSHTYDNSNEIESISAESLCSNFLEILLQDWPEEPEDQFAFAREILYESSKLTAVANRWKTAERLIQSSNTFLETFISSDGQDIVRFLLIYAVEALLCDIEISSSPFLCHVILSGDTLHDSGVYLKASCIATVLRACLSICLVLFESPQLIEWKELLEMRNCSGYYTEVELKNLGVLSTKDEGVTANMHHSLVEENTSVDTVRDGMELLSKEDVHETVELSVDQTELEKVDSIENEISLSVADEVQNFDQKNEKCGNNSGGGSTFNINEEKSIEKSEVSTNQTTSKSMDEEGNLENFEQVLLSLVQSLLNEGQVSYDALHTFCCVILQFTHYQNDAVNSDKHLLSSAEFLNFNTDNLADIENSSSEKILHNSCATKSKNISSRNGLFQNEYPHLLLLVLNICAIWFNAEHTSGIFQDVGKSLAKEESTSGISQDVGTTQMNVENKSGIFKNSVDWLIETLNHMTNHIDLNPDVLQHLSCESFTSEILSKFRFCFFRDEKSEIYKDLSGVRHAVLRLYEIVGQKGLTSEELKTFLLHFNHSSLYARDFLQTLNHVTSSLYLSPTHFLSLPLKQRQQQQQQQQQQKQQQQHQNYSSSHKVTKPSARISTNHSACLNVTLDLIRSRPARNELKIADDAFKFAVSFWLKAGGRNCGTSGAQKLKKWRRLTELCSHVFSVELRGGLTVQCWLHYSLTGLIIRLVDDVRVLGSSWLKVKDLSHWTLLSINSVLIRDRNELKLQVDLLQGGRSVSNSIQNQNMVQLFDTSHIDVHIGMISNNKERCTPYCLGNLFLFYDYKLSPSTHLYLQSLGPDVESLELCNGRARSTVIGRYIVKQLDPEDQSQYDISKQSCLEDLCKSHLLTYRPQYSEVFLVSGSHCSNSGCKDGSIIILPANRNSAYKTPANRNSAIKDPTYRNSVVKTPTNSTASIAIPASNQRPVSMGNIEGMENKSSNLLRPSRQNSLVMESANQKPSKFELTSQNSSTSKSANRNSAPVSLLNHNAALLRSINRPDNAEPVKQFQIRRTISQPIYRKKNRNNAIESETLGIPIPEISSAENESETVGTPEIPATGISPTSPVVSKSVETRRSTVDMCESIDRKLSANYNDNLQPALKSKIYRSKSLAGAEIETSRNSAVMPSIGEMVKGSRKTSEFLAESGSSAPVVRVNKSTSQAILQLGGVRTLLVLFAKVVEHNCCEIDQSLALQAALSSAQSNPQLTAELAAFSCYSLINKVLLTARCSLGYRILKVLLDSAMTSSVFICCETCMCNRPSSGYNMTACDKNGVKFHILEDNGSLISDVQLITDLLLDWRVWLDDREGVWLAGLTAVNQLIKPSHPYQRYNIERLKSVNIISRVLNLFLERMHAGAPSLSCEVCHELLNVISHVIGRPADEDSLLLVNDFLLLAHPAAQTSVPHHPTQFWFRNKWLESDVRYSDGRLVSGVEYSSVTLSSRHLINQSQQIIRIKGGASADTFNQSQQSTRMKGRASGDIFSQSQQSSKRTDDLNSQSERGVKFKGGATSGSILERAVRLFSIGSESSGSNQATTSTRITHPATTATTTVASTVASATSTRATPAATSSSVITTTTAATSERTTQGSLAKLVTATTTTTATTVKVNTTDVQSTTTTTGIAVATTTTSSEMSSAALAVKTMAASDVSIDTSEISRGAIESGITSTDEAITSSTSATVVSVSPTALATESAKPAAKIAKRPQTLFPSVQMREAINAKSQDRKVTSSTNPTDMTDSVNNKTSSHETSSKNVKENLSKTVTENSFKTAKETKENSFKKASSVKRQVTSKQPPAQVKKREERLSSGVLDTIELGRELNALSDGDIEIGEDALCALTPSSSNMPAITTTSDLSPLLPDDKHMPAFTPLALSDFPAADDVIDDDEVLHNAGNDDVVANIGDTDHNNDDVAGNGDVVNIDETVAQIDDNATCSDAENNDVVDIGDGFANNGDVVHAGDVVTHSDDAAYIGDVVDNNVVVNADDVGVHIGDGVPLNDDIVNIANATFNSAKISNIDDDIVGNDMTENEAIDSKPRGLLNLESVTEDKRSIGQRKMGSGRTNKFKMVESNSDSGVSSNARTETVPAAKSGKTFSRNSGSEIVDRNKSTKGVLTGVASVDRTICLGNGSSEDDIIGDVSDMRAVEVLNEEEEDEGMVCVVVGLLDLLVELLPIMKQSEMRRLCDMNVLLKPQTLTILANRASCAVRKSIIKMLRLYLSLIGGDDFNEIKGFYLLANQLSQHSVDTELIELCFALVLNKPVNLDLLCDTSGPLFQSSLGVTLTPNPESVCVVVALLENLIQSSAVCHKTLLALDMMMRTNHSVSDIMLRKCLPESLCNLIHRLNLSHCGTTLISSSSSSSSSLSALSSSTSYDVRLIVLALQGLLESIALKTFCTGGGASYHQCENILSLLQGLKSREIITFGSRSREVMLVQMLIYHYLKSILSYIDERLTGGGGVSSKTDNIESSLVTSSSASDLLQSIRSSMFGKDESFTSSFSSSSALQDSIREEGSSIRSHSTQTCSVTDSELVDRIKRIIVNTVDIVIFNCMDIDPVGPSLDDDEEAEEEEVKSCRRKDSLSVYVRYFIEFLVSSLVKCMFVQRRSSVGKGSMVSLVWKCKDCIRQQVCRLMVYMLSDRRYVSDRLFTVHLINRECSTFNLLPLIINYNDTGRKISCSLYELVSVHCEGLSRGMRSEINELINRLKTCGVPELKAGTKLTPSELLDIEKDKEIWRHLEETDKSEWLKKQADSRQKVLHRLDALSRSVDTTGAEIVRRVSHTQSQLRSELRKHIRTTLSERLEAKRAWQLTIAQLTHERSLWYDSSSYPQHWQIDSTEGPHRMRCRLQRCHLNIDKRFFLPQHHHKLNSSSHSPPLMYLFEEDSLSLDSKALIYKLNTSEDITLTCPCSMVTPESSSNAKRHTGGEGRGCFKPRNSCASSGSLLIGRSDIFYVADKVINENSDTQALLGNCEELFITLPHTDICEFNKQWYLLKDNALEIFLSSGKTCLLAFETTQDRDSVHSALQALHLPSLLPPDTLSVVQQKWLEGQLGNFEYLMLLNKLAGRTFNDLMQYPVFPFILSNYTTETIDLSNPSNYRDLSRTVATQNKDKEKRFMEKYEEKKRERDRMLDEGESVKLIQEPCHYSNYCSNVATVTQYLVRLPPYTNMFLLFQGGFDDPNRTFHSLTNLYRLIANESDTRDTRELIPEFYFLPEFLENNSDTRETRELIPEFYFLPEFLENNSGFNMHASSRCDHQPRADGATLHNILLPPYCGDNARLFTLIHRQALESDTVRQSLPQWLDLVFGYKQRGRHAVESVNLYPPALYYGLDIDAIKDEVDREAVRTMISTYGQAPKQLFKTPHPQPPSSSFSSRSSKGRALGSISGLRWGEYVGSPDSPLPMLVWKRLEKGVKCLKALVTGELFGLSENCALLVMCKAARARGILGSDLGVDWAAILSWNHSDNIIRIKNHRDQPANNFLHWSNSDRVTCCVSLPDLTRIIFGSDSGLITVVKTSFNDSTRCHVQVYERRDILYGHSGSVTGLVVCRPYSIMISSSKDNTIIIWDLNKLTYVRSILDHSHSITNLSVSDISGCIASSSNNGDGGSVLMLHTVNARLVGRVVLGTDEITCLTFSGCRRGVNCVVGGLKSGGVRLWCEWNLEPVREITQKVMTSAVISMTYSYDSQCLMIVNADGWVCLWAVNGKQKTIRFMPYTSVSATTTT